MASIHLIGVIHHDLRGAEILKKALELEKPNILTIEANRVILDYINNHKLSDYKGIIELISRKISNKQELSLYEEFYGAEFFEIDSCIDYSNRTGVPLFPIDANHNLPGLDGSRLSKWLSTNSPELLGEKLSNVIRNSYLRIDLRRENMINSFCLTYKKAENLFGGKIPEIEGEVFINEINDFFNRKSVGYRDQTMAMNLINLVGNYKGSRIVHVGGFVHCLNDSKGRTLYSKLISKGFKPTRRTLMSYD